MKKTPTITSCPHFIVSPSITLPTISFTIYLPAEDDNGSVLPTHDDHRAPADGDAAMDIDGTHQGLQHIPGVDDTTLLSNVSDEFVLPPISTTGNDADELNHFETNDFPLPLSSTNAGRTSSSETQTQTSHR